MGLDRSPIRPYTWRVQSKRRRASARLFLVRLRRTKLGQKGESLLDFDPDYTRTNGRTHIYRQEPSGKRGRPTYRDLAELVQRMSVGHDLIVDGANADSTGAVEQALRVLQRQGVKFRRCGSECVRVGQQDYPASLRLSAPGTPIYRHRRYYLLVARVSATGWLAPAEEGTAVYEGEVALMAAA